MLLVQIFGGLSGWRHVLAEARRVLRPSGALMLGRTMTPPDGIDARMKRQLDDNPRQARRRAEAEKHARGRRKLAGIEQAASHTRVTAATWTAERTPRGFIERHSTGARFSALPEEIKDAGPARA